MTLLLGVLVASLVGSVHCAAMCGGFVCLYAAPGVRATNFPAHAAYNAGRLVSYVTLGLVAGAVGARIDQTAALARVERGAAIVAGTLMAIWALAAIATSLGARRSSLGAPEWAKRRFGALLVALGDQPPAVRAAAMGLLTTLLPCGWLYTFVLTAGSTGDPIAGASVMFVFWAGTVPMLFAIGLGAQYIARPLARHLPVVSAVLVLTLGALSIAGRLRPLTLGDGAATQNHASHVGR